TGSPAPLGPGGVATADLRGVAGVPSSPAGAALVNITAVLPSADTHLTAWSHGLPMPPTSSVNAAAGHTVATLAIVPLSPSGHVDVANNAGSVDVLVDVVGWVDSGVGAGPDQGGELQ